MRGTGERSGLCPAVELLGREYDVEARDLQRDLSFEQPKLQNRWKRESKEKAKRKRTRVEQGGGGGGGDGEGDGDGGEGGDDDDAGSTVRRCVVAHPCQQSQVGRGERGRG